MIDYLIEIIFKSIPNEIIGNLLKDLTKDGKAILNYHANTELGNIDWTSSDLINEIFKKHSDFGLFLNLNSLNDPIISLPNCGLAIYKSNSLVSLEINFQLSDLKETDREKLSKKLMTLANSIAKKYQITECIGGIEPANDTNLRLFTNDKLGPINL